MDTKGKVSPEESIKNSKNKPRLIKPLLILFVVFLTITIVLFTAAYPELVFGAREGSCSPAPAPYREISNLFALDDGENNIFIVRGIVGDGTEYTSSNQGTTTFPPCWSDEEALETVANKFITVDNQSLLLIVGVIGRQQSADQLSPLPQP